VSAIDPRFDDESRFSDAGVIFLIYALLGPVLGGLTTLPRMGAGALGGDFLVAAVFVSYVLGLLPAVVTAAVAGAARVFRRFLPLGTAPLLVVATGTGVSYMRLQGAAADIQWMGTAAGAFAASGCYVITLRLQRPRGRR
jgi:hypothetical protein